MRASRFTYAVFFVLMLAGCATPASQYYSLLPSAQPGAQRAAPAVDFAISLQPVVLPDQVNRPQIVLSEPGNTEVQVLNQSLWAAPLSEEIRNALAHQLTSRLGVLDIPLGQAPRSLPVWRIDFTVQRFESTYNQDVVIEATWRLDLRNQSKKSVKICRAVARVAVGPGMSELVAGHQQALNRFAAVIAAQLRDQAPREEGVEVKGCT